jgi:hypothetical protein
VKVIEVALDKLAHRWSPEEIHFQHPGSPWRKFTRPSPITAKIRHSWTLKSSAGERKW